VPLLLIYGLKRESARAAERAEAALRP